MLVANIKMWKSHLNIREGSDQWHLGVLWLVYTARIRTPRSNRSKGTAQTRIRQTSVNCPIGRSGESRKHEIVNYRSNA